MRARRTVSRLLVVVLFALVSLPALVIAGRVGARALARGHGPRVLRRAVPAVRQTVGALQWHALAAQDGVACRAALVAAGTRFSVLPDRGAPDRDGCGIPHGVIVTRGPTGVLYNPPLVIDCALARALPDFEAALQDSARDALGAQVRSVGTLGTYACRAIRGYPMFTSQHAYGNAADLARFELTRGGAISVARDYGDAGARGRFLRGVYGRLRAGGALGHVLGPDDNADHRDHFHIDAAPSSWRMIIAL